MPSIPSQWSELRPTRRGVGGLLAAAAAIALAWLFGARSLNAVAAPMLVGVAVGVVQLLVTETPGVERRGPGAGFPGDTGTVTLHVDGGPTIVEVAETVPEGLDADGTATTSPPATVEYDLTYRARGRHALGPTTVRASDAFGLVRYTVTAGGTDDVLVYPAVYDLGGSEALSALLATRETPERQAFDTIREYTPGDPLRDVHWKTSAKHDDELFVKEFAGSEPTETLTVRGDAAEGGADGMASAVASVCVTVLERGLPVEVVLPSGTVTAQPTHEDRQALLSTLATVGAGRPESDVDADVTVEGTATGTTVAIGDRRVAFEQLREGTALLTERGDDRREVTA
jgi:uncharacterized protein (DUF58 family)